MKIKIVGGSMADLDEWGRDPSVIGMRKVFKEMERRQGDLLKQLNISMVDFRLRKWRQQALFFFNDVWARASRLGISMDVYKAGTVYAAGLSKVLQMEGLVLPDALVSHDADIEMLFEGEDT
jgi:hypothetical protein